MHTEADSELEELRYLVKRMAAALVAQGPSLRPLLNEARARTEET